VTSQPQPGQFLRPLRDLAAYTFVGVPAVLLFVAIVRLIPDGANQFGYRTQDSFYGFVNTATIFLPMAAVLLALLVQPRHPKASLITLVALVEYAVMAFFGVFFGLLIGLINLASDNGARSAFEELLVRLAWLAVFGVPAYAVFRIWQGLFHVAKPKPQPGVYGQPAYGQPGTYPGQPGYGTPPQPGYAPGAYPPPSGPPPSGPQPSGPQQFGPQPSGPQPSGPQQFGPQSGPSQAPAWTPPVAPAPGAFPAFAEPTQVVPQAEPEWEAPEPSGDDRTQKIDDRTQKINDDRPGFGPAADESPRG